MIEINRLSKSFIRTLGNREKEFIKVLDALDFRIEKGQFTCIIGPTGCGKTTLLKIIAGLLESDDGNVLIDGISPTDTRQKIGYVFQEYNLLPWRNVFKNIVFGKELLLQKQIGSQEDIEKIERLIQLLRLPGLLEKYPHQLSGGEKQRVGLARALMVEPDILIMDEPLSSADAITREIIELGLLRYVEAKERYIIFATHDIDEAVFLGNRVLAMSNKPTKIIEDISIKDAPLDRSKDWRFSQEFTNYTFKLRELLL